MPTLYPGITTIPGQLDWFTSINGNPVDMYAISYEIFYIPDPLNPATRISVYVESNALSIKTGVGEYYARWAIPEGIDPGDYIIEWTYQWLATSSVQTGSEEFTIITEPPGTADSKVYISVQDLYAEGVPIGKYTTEFLEGRILRAQQYIEKLTGRIFLASSKEIYIDGTGGTLLHGPELEREPIVEITKLEVDSGFGDDWHEYPLKYFEFYGGVGYQDYSRVKVRDSRGDSLLSNLTLINGFPRGARNVRLTGTFGYVDEDRNTPQPIKLACALLVKKYLPKAFSRKFAENMSEHMIQSETTDGHRYTLFSKALATGRLTGDPTIDDILTQYMSGATVRVVGG